MFCTSPINKVFNNTIQSMLQYNFFFLHGKHNTYPAERYPKCSCKNYSYIADSRLLHNLCIESNAIHRSFVLTGLFIYFFYAEVCMTNVTEPIWWKISEDSNSALKAVIVILQLCTFSNHLRV